jgi:hypothetical protein
MANNYSKDFIKMLEKFFAKAPHMPENARLTLVKIFPWIAIFFGVLGVLGGIAGLAAVPAGYAGGSSLGFISIIIWLASSVLLLAAYPGLKARKAKGWDLLFWSEVVSAIGSIVEMQLISAVIGALIGFYLLFEVKSHYK